MLHLYKEIFVYYRKYRYVVGAGWVGGMGKSLGIPIRGHSKLLGHCHSESFVSSQIAS